MSIGASTMPVHDLNHAHSASLQIERGHCPHQQIANEVKPHLAPTFIRATDRRHPIRTTSWQVRCMLPSVVGLQSCLCGNEHADATRSSNSSPRRSPHPTCARTLQTPLHERIVRALSAAWKHAQGTESDRCVVLCCNDACVRALTANNLSYISITIHMSMQLSYKKGYLERIWPQQSEKKEQRSSTSSGLGRSALSHADSTLDRLGHSVRLWRFTRRIL